MPACTVEILAIGNEVLAGDVLDTNSHWLCRQLTSQGARVLRITVLPDVEDVIGEALRAALARRPALILTCGGLGPTVDDLTTAAIGAALGRPVAEDPQAYGMVRDTYAFLHARGLALSAEMTPARAKMARLPAGATPLANSAGAAPGVLLVQGDTTVVCLPGVPAEMQAICEQVLWPRLAANFAGQVHAERTIVTGSYDETTIAPTVDAVALRHGDVYVKSRAQAYGGGQADFITLAARAADAAQAAALLDAAEFDLLEALAAIGVRAFVPGSAKNP
jgi:molybdenum cofactor synthesis domain-containing protein